MQIVENKHGQRRILEHLGSAHAEAELLVLVEIGHPQAQSLARSNSILAWMSEERQPGVGVVQDSLSRLLIDVVRGAARVRRDQ